VFHFSSHVGPKWMFIVKEGILRRGTIVGAIVTLVFIVMTHGDKVDSGYWVTLGLTAACFLEWTIGAGWLIGAAMWSMREQAARRRQRNRPF
jgi:hypothetical protein